MSILRLRRSSILADARRRSPVTPVVRVGATTTTNDYLLYGGMAVLAVGLALTYVRGIS